MQGPCASRHPPGQLAICSPGEGACVTGVQGTRQVGRHHVHLLQLHWQLNKAQLDLRAFVTPQLTDVFIICCSMTGYSSSLQTLEQKTSGGSTPAVFVPLQMRVNVKVPERYFGKCVYYL